MADDVRERLHVVVSCALLDLPQSPALDDVHRHIAAFCLDDDADRQRRRRASVGSVRPLVVIDERTARQLQTVHASQLRTLILQAARDHIAQEVDRDPRRFSPKTFKSEHLLKMLQSAPNPFLQVLKDQAAFAPLKSELGGYQRWIAGRLLLFDTETIFADRLADWLRSGEPTKDQWLALRQWYEGGGRLDAFRSIEWKDERRDGLLSKLLQTVHQLRGVQEFKEMEQIRTLLHSCCSVTLTKIGQELQVTGGTIPISAVLIDILLALPSVHTVSIYATECVTLDVSLDQPAWSGLNLCIVSSRMCIHEDVVIDLSGRSYDACSEASAPAATNVNHPGTDGKSGRAGESAGNLCILVDELIGGNRLSVRLNGGRGEDGQHGGDGCDGEDGIGEDTRNDWLELKYASVVSPHPENMQRCLSDDSSGNMYDYEYVDDNGLCVHRWAYPCPDSLNYDLLVFVRGTQGTQGSRGGASGAGGQGGFAGTCQIENPVSGRSWRVCSVQRSAGCDGENGHGGQGGADGAEGHDMYYARIYENFINPKDNIGGGHGRKLCMTLGRSPYYLAKPPPNYITLPVNRTGLRLLDTYAIFEETPARARAPGTINDHIGNRQLATARATLQASTAIAEFARVTRQVGLQAAIRQPVEEQIAPETTESNVKPMENTLRVINREQRSRIDITMENEIDEKEQKAKATSLLKLDLWARLLFLLSRSMQSTANNAMFERNFRSIQAQVLLEHHATYEAIQQRLSSEELVEELVAIENMSLQRWLKLIELHKDGTGLSHLASMRLCADKHSSTSAFEWRAILDIACSLMSETHCMPSFLILIIDATPASQLLNAFVLLRLIACTQSVDLDMIHALLTIEPSEAKALLTLRINNLRGELSVDDACTVLRLLQDSDQQLHILSRISLSAWMEMASHQKAIFNNWKEFGGKTAFYLGELDRSTVLAQDADLMRAVLRKWKSFDRIFAGIVHFIISREIDTSTFYEKLAEAALKEDEMAITRLFPSDCRTIDHLVQLMCDDSDVQTRAEVRRIGSIISTKDTSPDHHRLLNDFDCALEKVTGKHLRATQKMAVMCALESETSLLQQVATGEGKSYIIAAVAAIRCLLDPQATVDIITSSSVLAERDATELALVYKELGLEVAHNCEEGREARGKSYKARVVYGDMQHFQRDFLLHTFYRKNILGTRTRDCVIVDEVDSMMLDNSNHVLYLSHKIPSMKLLDSLFVYIQRQVYTDFYGSKIDERCSTEKIRLRTLREIFGRISMTDHEDAQSMFTRLRKGHVVDDEGFLNSCATVGIDKLLHQFDCASIVRHIVNFERDREKEIQLPQYLHDFVRLHISTFIDNCKRARLMQPDIDYVVDVDRSTNNDEHVVTIIDTDTGADLSSTQWTGGLHQFLQMKHACRVTPISLKAVFISNVTYLRGYKRIDGLSGTLGSAEESSILAELYGVKLIRIPTYTPRRMQEYLPVLSESDADWLGSMYQALKAAVDQGRSVLIICETIHQLRRIEIGLRNLNGVMRERSDLVNKAFDTITIYKRKHEEMEYEQAELDQGRIIISTNLAGRGTDIRISSTLAAAGGLHVIVAFVPRNKRIEDQAYGRAARAGAPGSAQIIARIGARKEAVVPPFLDFKWRRDMEETRRIQELMDHYNYNIAVEEGALQRFREHIDRHLFRNDAPNEMLPEADDVIFRALLDEWTLWLDGQAKNIEACKTEKSPKQNEEVITSVASFLSAHAVEKYNELFHVPKWIRTGEWRLRLGLIQACHKMGRADAEATFNKLIEESDHFAPFAHFYLGCMLMLDFEDMRKEQKSVLMESPDGGYKVDVDEAAAMLKRARVLLGEQRERREEEVRSMLQFAERTSGVSGLERQLEELASAHSHIIANIDWLVGEPLSPESFRLLTNDAQRQQAIFDSLSGIGVISPPLLTTLPPQKDQLRCLRRKFDLDEKQLCRGMQGITDTCRIVSRSALITPYFALPTREDFWNVMSELGVFHDIVQVYVLKEEHRKDAVSNILSRKPLSIGKKTARLSLLFSNRSLSALTIYTSDELDILEPDTVRQFLEDGSLEKDRLARIDVDRLIASHLPEFDGFTSDDLNMNADTTEWLLDALSSRGVITRQTGEIYAMTEQWRERFSTKRVKMDKFIDKEELAQLGCCKSFTLANLSKTRRAREKESEEERARFVRKLQDELIDAKVLERRTVEFCLPSGAIDCSMLPCPIAEAMQEFLSHHFSYTFTKKVLAAACEDSHKEPFIAKQVLLPADSHQELYNELCRLELISLPRIISPTYDHKKIETIQNIDNNELRKFIDSRRLKLRKDEELFFELVPFVEVLAENDATVSSEMESLIDLGMAAGVTLRKKVPFMKRLTMKIMNVLRKIFGYLMEATKIISQLVNSLGTSALSYVLDIGAKLVPESVKQVYRKMLALFRWLGWLKRKIGAGMSACFKQLKKAMKWMKVSTVGAARKLGKAARAIYRGMIYFHARCRAAFGSTEYYKQCRMAMQTSRSNDVVNFQMLRTFNQIGEAVSMTVEEVAAREEELLGQVNKAALELRRVLLNETGASLTITATRPFFETLDSRRQFETDLELIIKVACMHARLTLLRKEEVDLSDYIKSKRTALRLAHTSMSDDCREAAKIEDEEVSLDILVDELLHCTMDSFFITPLISLVKSVCSKHFAAEMTDAESPVLEDENSMRGSFTFHNSIAWLERLQEDRLVASVHKMIADTEREMFRNDEETIAQRLADLTQYCSTYGIPLPEPST